jgi:small subunit ribosomal protein S20
MVESAFFSNREEPVANHASAKKRIRQTHKRTLRNKHVRSTVRSSVKDVRTAVTAGDGKKAQEALSVASRRIAAAVTKGVLHKKTASRYVSRLTLQVNALAK